MVARDAAFFILPTTQGKDVGTNLTLFLINKQLR